MKDNNKEFNEKILDDEKVKQVSGGCGSSPVPSSDDTKSRKFRSSIDHFNDISK